MRTCLALWHDYIISRLSHASDKQISDFAQVLYDNNICALFDGSKQSRELTALMQRIHKPNHVPLFDYELEARIALSYASSVSSTSLPAIPFTEQQHKILQKLRIRHLSILEHNNTHWTSVLILYNRFLEFIDSNRIERIIFSEYPHTIFDYLFSLASINSNVRCYALQFVGQLGREYSYIIDMNKHAILPCPFGASTPADDFLDFLDTHNYQLTSYSSPIQSLYTYSRDLSRREAFQLASNGHNGFTLWSQKQSNAIRTYNSLVEKSANVPTQPFGIFYLQVEPESTVTPLSGYFSDQIAAVSDFYNICMERGLVPCLKEHPHQYQDLYPFSANSHWQSHPTITAAKSSDFYLKLKQNLPLLNFLPIRLNPAKLFEDSNYVLSGTLNGTIGVQSISCGKEVVEYGLAWYQCHPLVISRRYDAISGNIYTETNTANTIINTTAIEAGSNAAHYISGIVKLFDTLSLIPD